MEISRLLLPPQAKSRVHLPQVTEPRGWGEASGVSENKPFIVALWVSGDLQGLNEGEEAGAGVGAGVHCHPSALPGGEEGAPCTCSRTGLAGQTPVPSCFLSGAIAGVSQAWGKGVGGERTERGRRKGGQKPRGLVQWDLGLNLNSAPSGWGHWLSHIASLSLSFLIHKTGLKRPSACNVCVCEFSRHV